MPVRLSPYTRATNYSTLNTYIPVTYNLNNCKNTLCYTSNHNYIYAPTSGYGTTVASYLASRKRL